MQIGKALTVVVAIMGVALVGSLIYVNYFAAQDAYNMSIKYSVSKLPASYDFSCDEPVYGLYVVISNNGTKTVADFSVSISNPLCKAAVPPLSNALLPSQQAMFYVYSSQQDGTLTISGNNTLVEINF
ncbi:MAG: hypothetical protein ACRECH_02265 [Nitrososphaerales archaeon]